jgi:hypothetical protein
LEVETVFSTGEEPTSVIDVAALPKVEAPAVVPVVEGKPDEGTTPEAKPEVTEPDEATETPAADLGEYKPEDADVVAKFDQRYTNPETGKLNEVALSTEFWGNRVEAAEGVEPVVGKLNDATRDYLVHSLNVTPQFIDEVCEGLVAKQQMAAQGHSSAVHGVAGSAERYNAALDWAMGPPEGGTAPYTPEQQARFDAVVRNRNAGWEDAVTALMARFDAANPPAQSNVAAFRRRSTPARDATSPNAGPKAATTQTAVPNGPEPFANAEAYHNALREAATPRQTEEANARLRASTFYKTT